jgi:hypothetical protein
LKKHLVSVAILIAVIGSAAFQIMLLVVASWSGIETVGAVSLFQSVAVLICAIGLSDLKSLSIRNLVEDHSLQALCRLRNTFLLAICVIAVLVWVLVPSGEVLAALIVIRASSQAADVNISVWQKTANASRIILFSLARYVIVGSVLALAALVGGNFAFGACTAAAISALVLVFEQSIITKTSNQIGVSWRLIRLRDWGSPKLFAAYASLSLSAGLNFLPQTILRYFIGAFGSMYILGSFSVQYQMSMLSIPFITALSQQALARRNTEWRDVVRDLALIVPVSILLIGIATITFITPAANLLVVIFKSWSPLPIYSSLIIAVSSVFLCVTVYLGFMSVALHRPFAQSIANVCFLMLLLTFGYGLGLVFGVPGILLGFLISTIVRAVLLALIVRSAARP